MHDALKKKETDMKLTEKQIEKIKNQAETDAEVFWRENGKSNLSTGGWTDAILSQITARDFCCDLGIEYGEDGPDPEQWTEMLELFESHATACYEEYLKEE
jgi:hypothetical protein